MITVAATVSIPAWAADATPAPVELGTATSFAVLAGAGISNTGPTTINGDIGTYPTATINAGGRLTVNGDEHGANATSHGAQEDLNTASNAAAAEVPADAIITGLGGQTLAPGIYNSSSSLDVTGALTLDGGGDPNAVFVFQTASALTTASASQVQLVNGTQACNVFWQVGSSATIGTGTSLAGTVMAQAGIAVTTGSNIDGRLLSRTGTVTLDTATVTVPTCTTPTGLPNPSPATGTPSTGKAVVKAGSGTLPPRSIVATPTTATTPSTTVPGTTATTTTTTPSVPGAGGPTAKRSRSATSICAKTERARSSARSFKLASDSNTRIRTSSDGSVVGRSALGCATVTGFKAGWALAAGGVALAAVACFVGFRRLRRRQVLS